MTCCGACWQLRQHCTSPSQHRRREHPSPPSRRVGFLFPACQGWTLTLRFACVKYILPKIKWGHYEALADGIARTIAVQLKLPQKDVRTNGSILVGDGVAEPRLIVEVPIEHKRAVATDKVWAAIQYVTDLVRGAVALEGIAGSSDFHAQAVAANDPGADREDLDPTELPANSDGPVGADGCVATAASEDLFDTATRGRLQSVARRVLSKVGGATLDVPCNIQVEGLTCEPIR